MARSSNSPIDRSKQNKVRDIMKMIIKLKWYWAGYLARITDNRWTTCITFRTPPGTHTEPRTTIFQSIKSYIFPKGLTHDFDPKIQIFFCLFLVKIWLQIVLDDAVDKKNAFKTVNKTIFYVWKIPFFQRRKPILLVTEFEFFYFSLFIPPKNTTRISVW